MSLWTGIIDPLRAIDWNTAGVAGGIPSGGWANCVTAQCNTLFGGTVTVQTINDAITSAIANTVVRVPPGTFTIAGGINITRNNVAVRGMGADQTKLVFTAGDGCAVTPGADFCVWSRQFNDPFSLQHTGAWTAGYTKGTTVITLDSTTGLVVGNLIMLDQCNDGFTGASCTGAPSDGGDIFVCDVAPTCCIDGGTSIRRTARAQVEVKTVVAINGLNVTIDPPLAMPNWRSEQSPGAWWGNTTTNKVGIEDMTIDMSGASGLSAAQFYNALNCWVKGVRTVVNVNTGAQTFGHIRIFVSARITVRDSYFYGNFAGSNLSATEYTLSPEGSGDLLIENNIIQFNNGGIVPNAWDVGSIYGYNFIVNSLGNGFIPHNSGQSMTLWEGNSGNQIWTDIFHGTHHFMTTFRNHFDSGQPGYWRDTVSRHSAYQRFFNLIGNVLGGSVTAVYERTNNNGDAVYVFGDNQGSGSFGNDARVAATVMRWGNYDTVNAGVRFIAGEVPSGLTNFANPVPASQTLPSSFYLASQPAWWSTPFGTPPFPAVGPDVTGGNIAGYAGHVYKIPARLCFENSIDDPAYPSSNPRIKSFSASACYGVAQTVALPVLSDTGPSASLQKFQLRAW